MSRLGDSVRKAKSRQKGRAGKIVWNRRPDILLCPRIPKPLHGVNPRTIMGKNWWDRTRRAAYRSTNWHCIACGISKWDAKHRQWLEGHEVYVVDWLMGVAEYVETVPLCHFCHNYIHHGRLSMLLDRGMITHQKFVAIIQHGDEVLRSANLTKTEYDGPFADWSDWRMVFDGNEYKPLYRSEREWIEANLNSILEND